VGALEAWVRDETQAVGVRRLGSLPGGSTASVHLLRVRTGLGEHDLIAKVYDGNVSLSEATEAVQSEQFGLSVAANGGLPVPTVICSDAGGETIGQPVLVMTRLPGRPVAQPSVQTGPSLHTWVQGLATALGRVAKADVVLTDLPPAQSWCDLQMSKPSWCADDGLWSAALSRLGGGLAGGPARLIHRDFHQLNVLWHQGQISGIVDWVHASQGPTEFDVSVCRVNIALVAGLEAADALLAACGPLCADYQRAWDLETVIALAPSTPTLLNANALGAELTLPGIHSTLLDLLWGALT
jgi:aminoglycoside phosphotransferase (APT) family kinase protein